MPDATPKKVRCVVVTPERAVLDESADYVVVTLYDGELGILPGRAALVGRLGQGELRIRRGDLTERYYIDGGFAQVRGDVVTVLTPLAIKGVRIDVEEANRQLVNPTGTTQADRDRAKARARAQLRVVANAAERTHPAFA